MRLHAHISRLPLIDAFTMQPCRCLCSLPCTKISVSNLLATLAAAGAVLPAVNDRSEGVPDRWRTYLEQSSL